MRRLLAVAASPLLVWAAVSVAVGDPDYALRALGAATDTPAAASSADDGMGKPAGSDEEQGKSTYPALLGLEKSRELAREQARAAQQALAPFDGPEADFLRALADYTVTRAA